MPSHESGSRVPKTLLAALAAAATYPERLVRLADELERASNEARDRGIYGLAEALTEAEASCRSWAEPEAQYVMDGDEDE